ncbi:MAG: type II toxin-antitoxin system RelE/ParE family toxin [Oscillospiraceae bacterium]|nr:type II toxin-antitoxin system RelE/ParE family toxin [Oscillospiraceae bacterium]
MKTVLTPQAAKYLGRLNEPVKSRIQEALRKLEQEPPQGDIKALSGQAGFRLRVGSYRILFGIKADTIVVTDIAPRGRVYKGR